MSDIALVLDLATLSIDMALDGADLKTDVGLGTAVLISLESDALARPDDILPGGSGDRRGWWGDQFAEVAGDVLGSRRWLLERAKLTDEALRLLKDHDEVALAWLKADGIARSIDITVERDEADRDRVNELIVITRLDGTVSRFSHVWGL